MNKVGVIGAGLMGNGIAHVAAAAGYDVILSDVSIERAEAGKANIEKNLGRQLAKGGISEADFKATLDRVRLTTDTAEFRDAGLVIEAATENEEIKNRIFADLGPKLSADTVIATNTPSISITRLGAKTDRPDRFVGLHFFNPVPMMALVEIIRGLATADNTAPRAAELVTSHGKTAPENEEIKNRIFADLGPNLSADTVIATNTSSISITRLGAKTDRPDRFVGLHFFNPVPMMALVEIIRGLATSDKTAALAAELVKRIGKTALDAEDAPGFIVNRILCRSEEQTSELQSL